MRIERTPIIDHGLKFNKKSAELYRRASKLMVNVAEQCFKIKLPQAISDCWGDTLELMYYADHVLDHIKDKDNRTEFAHHCIECMFADPLDWSYLDFGLPDMDQVLNQFRKNFISLQGINENVSDITLELFKKTEDLKKSLTIEEIADSRIIESETCAKLLLGIGNDLVDLTSKDEYIEWLNRFWRFGNLADLFIDFGDDVTDGLIQTPNTIQNRFKLGKIAIRELFKLLKLSNPWLVAKYVNACRSLIEDKQ